MPVVLLSRIIIRDYATFLKLAIAENSPECYYLAVKKLICLIAIIFTSAILFAVSFNNGESIEIRDNLFYSEKELQSFSWSTSLTESEREYYDKVTISLITGGRGDEIWEYFGHAAFLLETEDSESIMFDYGVFSFDKKFYINFALGKLYYRMLASYGRSRILALKSADRDIYKLELDLNATQKKNLIAFLEYNNKTENRTYLYDYYLDNCATRLRDIYSAMDSSYKEWAMSVDTYKSFRDYTIEYLSPNFLASFGIVYLLGPNTDKDLTLYEAAFLPDVLRESIEEFQGSKSDKFYSSETKSPINKNAHFYIKCFLLSLVLCAISLLQYSKPKTLRKLSHGLLSLVYLIFGIMSLALLFLETMSIHKAAYFNTSLLVISPLTLYFFFLHITSLFGKEKRAKLYKAGKLYALFLIVLIILKFALSHFFFEANLGYYIVMLLLYSSETIRKA